MLPDTKVYYLNGDLSPQELKDLNFAGADYNGLSLIRLKIADALPSPSNIARDTSIP